MTENVWEILVEEAPTAGGAPAARAGVSPEQRKQTSELKAQTTQAKQQTVQFKQQLAGTMGVMGMAKKFLPWLIGIGGIATLVKSSKTIGAFTTSLRNIVGAIFDVFFAPLAPLLAAVLKLFLPFVPLVSVVMSGIIGPFVKAVTPVVNFIVDKLGAVVD